jgi:hypothetical protein
MFTGALVVLFWGIIALLGAMSAFVFVLGMRSVQ